MLLGLDVRVLDGLAPFGQIRLDAITRLLRCEVHGLVAFAFDRGDHGRIFHDLVDAVFHALVDALCMLTTWCPAADTVVVVW